MEKEKGRSSIKLGKETSEFVSRYFNAKIEYINIEDGDYELNKDIVEFIKKLISKRREYFLCVANPYSYDKKNKLLEIYSRYI